MTDPIPGSDLVMRRCSTCRRDLPLETGFYRCRRRTGGREYICKDCQRAQKRSPAGRAIAQRYRAAHKDQARLYQAGYRAGRRRAARDAAAIAELTQLLEQLEGVVKRLAPGRSQPRNGYRA